MVIVDELMILLEKGWAIKLDPKFGAIYFEVSKFPWNFGGEGKSLSEVLQSAHHFANTVDDVMKRSVDNLVKGDE